MFLTCLACELPRAHAAPQTATINSASISYEVCGTDTAPPVVLLHDGMANSAVWDGVFPLLCEKYRVVRYDRRGYGKSPATKAQHVPHDDLWGVMQHVGMSHAHLIAASAGAGIALDLLFDKPEAIDKLVLVAPALTGLQLSDGFIARLQKLDEHIRSGDMNAIIAAINADPHFFGPGDTRGREALEKILRANPGDLGAHPNQMRPPATAQRLGEIYAPTLVVIGGNDDPYNHAVVKGMQERMRAAQTHTMIGAGQFLYMDNPDAFATLVIQYLQ